MQLITPVIASRTMRISTYAFTGKNGFFPCWQYTAKQEKSSLQIGHAVWVKQNCVPLTDGVECGNCARHCPTGAITMMPSDPDDEWSLKVPVVNTATCIGCGACENLCPARPLSAIYVEGHEMHRVI